jgi:hypothetical protein
VCAWRASGALVFSITHRRHLNESQRAMVAAKIATMAEGRPSETRPIGLVSQDNAAEMLNVSTRSVKRAKAVQESGDASGFHARHHARV